MDWRDRPALVTGGMSFIGSHLVEQLLARGAHVRVVDDLSSGRLEYYFRTKDPGDVARHLDQALTER